MTIQQVELDKETVDALAEFLTKQATELVEFLAKQPIDGPEWICALAQTASAYGVNVGALTERMIPEGVDSLCASLCLHEFRAGLVEGMQPEEETKH